MSVPLASPEASALMNTLARIVNAVDIVAPDRFIWAGQVVALQAGVPPSLYPHIASAYHLVAGSPVSARICQAVGLRSRADFT